VRSQGREGVKAGSEVCQGAREVQVRSSSGRLGTPMDFLHVRLRAITSGRFEVWSSSMLSMHIMDPPLHPHGPPLQPLFCVKFSLRLTGKSNR